MIVELCCWGFRRAARTAIPWGVAQQDSSRISCAMRGVCDKRSWRECVCVCVRDSESTLAPLNRRLVQASDSPPAHHDRVGYSKRIRTHSASKQCRKGKKTREREREPVFAHVTRKRADETRRRVCVLGMYELTKRAHHARSQISKARVGVGAEVSEPDGVQAVQDPRAHGVACDRTRRRSGPRHQDRHKRFSYRRANKRHVFFPPVSATYS